DQMRLQVIAATAPEFREEVVRPVGVIDFETVGENRIWTIWLNRFQQTVAHAGEIAVQRRTIEVIDDGAFRADGWPLHLHPGPARNEKVPAGCAGIGGRR